MTESANSTLSDISSVTASAILQSRLSQQGKALLSVAERFKSGDQGGTTEGRGSMKNLPSLVPKKPVAGHSGAEDMLPDSMRAWVRIVELEGLLSACCGKLESFLGG